MNAPAAVNIEKASQNSSSLKVIKDHRAPSSSPIQSKQKQQPSEQKKSGTVKVEKITASKAVEQCKEIDDIKAVEECNESIDGKAAEECKESSDCVAAEESKENSDSIAVEEKKENSDSTAVEECKENSDSKAVTSNNMDFPSPDAEEDEEVRLAMEMAIAAAKNPHLSPSEIQKLVGEKNVQAKLIDEFAKKNEEKIKMNQLKAKEYQRQQSSTTSSWWVAATKKAEEIKDRAERSLYAEQISKDETILEIRKTMKILKKTLKAHRLQGNRVETRHVFKRQRMEKRLIQSNDKLKKTQQMFINSNYNVQEYLKAMMRASKKWRKIGNDDELMLEAQLSRNMHQMLALEKQKVKCKKNTKEMKKYLQRCKGWLSDKKAFCEMNIMTLDATQNSILRLYEETLRRQDRLIAKCKASAEFKGVDLLAVDLSHVTFPAISVSRKEVAPTTEDQAQNGIAPLNPKETAEHSASDQAQSRQKLLQEYYKQQQQEPPNTPELYVVANRDDASVSSRLSDPDASLHEESEEEDGEAYGADAPWRRRFDSHGDSSDDCCEVPSKTLSAEDSTSPPPASEGSESNAEEE